MSFGHALEMMLPFFANVSENHDFFIGIENFVLRIRIAFGNHDLAKSAKVSQRGFRAFFVVGVVPTFESTTLVLFFTFSQALHCHGSPTFVYKLYLSIPILLF